MKPTSIIHRLVILLITLMSAIGANAAEAYACYTSGNTTLTFYYDNQRNSRPGTTYDLNTDYNDPDWLSYNVTKVVFNSSFADARPTSTYSWFYNMDNLQSIEGMNYLNTSEVTNMDWMFGYCKKLKSLDLSSFNTAIVTNMDYMFNGCTSLQTIYAGSGWRTNTVSSSLSMFSDCSSLKGGRGTTWNSSNPTDKTYAHIDGGSNNLGYFTAKGILAYACYTESNTTLTFYYDNQRNSRSGTTYDLNIDHPDWLSYNVTKVVFNSSFADARPTSTNSWFFGMAYLQSIEGMSYLNTSEVTDMAWMFFNCSNLWSLDLSSFNTAKVTDMGRMFSVCQKLTFLDLSSFNTAKVTNMGYMFDDCESLRTIYVGDGWSTAAVTNSEKMFSNCTSLVGGKGTTYNASQLDKTYAHIDGGTSTPGYFTDINSLMPYACYTPENTTFTFYYDKQRGSRSGRIYDLYTGDNFTEWYVDDTKFNVTKVVFDPSFAEARPTTTHAWFYNMTSLESIEGMKYLNTGEVTIMEYMFLHCNNLTSLDLSSFNTSKVVDMDWMFRGCTNLQTVYVGDGWSTAAVTESERMFYDCNKLVGGQGTKYNANHVDKTYAHIDGGSYNPGYFSKVPEAYACYYDGTLSFYYDYQRNSRPGTTYGLNTDHNDPDWLSYNVTKVVFNPSFAGARPTSTYGWFYDMRNLQSIEGLSYLNTSEVTNMDWMFGYCSSLKSLDLSSFNTAIVTDMDYMFNGCTSLQTIYAGSGWRTNTVSSSLSMFSDCSSLKGGRGTTWNSSNPTDKTYAHIDGGTSNPGYYSRPPEAYACYTTSNHTLTFYYDNLRTSREGTYDLNTGSQDTGWETDGTNSYVTKVVFDPSFANARPKTTYSWFYGMMNLQSITGLNNLNTSEVTNMAWMFCDCFKLTTLDLSSFNTSKVVYVQGMFYGSTDLQTIYVGDGWSTAGVTSSFHMFSECSKLKGGQGTTWNSSNPTDETYAHIDGGSNNPGYFTYKKPSGIATDLHQVTSDKSQVISDEWYTIDGRKLNGMPAKKGIYIQNGQKRIIK